MSSSTQIGGGENIDQDQQCKPQPVSAEEVGDVEFDSDCSSLTDEAGADKERHLGSESPVEGEGGDVSDDEGSEDEDPNAWDDDEYPPLDLNYDALKQIAKYYIAGNHGKCTDIIELGRGTFHEVRRLEFEDGWSCIGRFTRDRSEHVSVIESETATVKYVKAHTSIPVPETYFFNVDPSNAIGAPFALMEKLEGQHLYNNLDRLTLDHKTAVIAQIVDVLVQLASLRFDKIRSVEFNGEIGRLQTLAFPQDEPGRGPYSTTQDWMLSYIDEADKHSTEAMEMWPYIKGEVKTYLKWHARSPILHTPYRLYHSDFDAQNMLFTWDDESQPPKLSGIIDWDYSCSAPLYYVLEYPIFIQDNDSVEDDFDDNKILRKSFVQKLAQSFPRGSQDREDVRMVFRMKSFLLNQYEGLFMRRPWADDPEGEMRVAEFYKKVLNGEEDLCTGAYDGVINYEPDSELESDDDDEDDQD